MKRLLIRGDGMVPPIDLTTVSYSRCVLYALHAETCMYETN